ncbi:DNA end-binding protein Ku [Pararhizobium capsulatum DSM 1112]|uniref:Non-homologous end joining protein Ku n=1 Tax=Pararhizobium capsulatum DSM 1112 TaxID=1121113 RepID=A0ABU0BYG7_9HYPH|nr:Ku protein [Pararhizobium capsulatum]MDQ0323310.1 DNA end-binding protein Ku [Pararhizobium capsulatum DSM 1112]
MAPRSFWKGYLKLSLVNCAVSMVPATTESEKVRFHTLNRATENRVVSRYVDSVTGREVDEDDEVKGFERGENEYVMLEDDEIDAVALESTRTINVETFVPKDDIEWIWYDTPHYLTPSDKVGQEAFAVIREAMASREVVGISKLVMYRRERAVMLEPRDNGIILWTLRYGDEVRDPKEFFSSISSEKSESGYMQLMEKFIEARSTPWDPSIVDDPVQDRILDMIAKRKKTKPRKKAPAKVETKRPSNVIDIMDALKKSLEASKK